MISEAVNYEGDLVLKSGKFKFGAWGGYAFDDTYSEFDFHLGYAISRHLTFEVWDLYASRDRASINDYQYFDFDRNTTNHLIDASIKYDFNDKLPLTVSWSTLIWGRDLDENNNQNFSSYFELNYRVRVNKTDVTFNLGTNVFANALYADHTNIVDIGLTASQEFKINEQVKIPVWAKVAINPDAEKANLIIGFNF